MARDGEDAPPPGFMDGPPTYDLEELIHINRLMGDFDRMLEQILSVDPNGMMRIHQSVQRAGARVTTTRAPIPDRGLH